jgi:hypothetical protein
VGFEPTYRGFADHEKLTNNSFTFRVVGFCSVSFVRIWSALSDLGSGKATWSEKQDFDRSHPIAFSSRIVTNGRNPASTTCVSPPNQHPHARLGGSQWIPSRVS